MQVKLIKYVDIEPDTSEKIVVLIGIVESEDRYFVHFLTGSGRHYAINKSKILVLKDSQRTFNEKLGRPV